MPVAGGAASSLMPPEMHWALLLVLTSITCELGGLVWAFREALFVKKIDPASKGVLWLVVSLFGMAAQIVVYIGMFSATSIFGAQADLRSHHAAQYRHSGGGSNGAFWHASIFSRLLQHGQARGPATQRGDDVLLQHPLLSISPVAHCAMEEDRAIQLRRQHW